MTRRDTPYIASPSVRARAAREGVDLGALARETGRETLGHEDVSSAMQAAAGPGAATAGPGGADDPTRFWRVDHAAHGPVREEKLSRPALLAAQNLAAASSLIPQVTHHDEADMRAITAFRDKCRNEAAARGIRLTPLAFQVMALARCLRDFPRFNASLSPDGQTLILKTRIHIGIAVDTPAGLVVPVIRNADRKGLWQIAREITDLATRARDRKIRPDEIGGASMTISNLGGIGGTAFTPIVNPPELAILGITKTEIKPEWDGETFQPVPKCPLDLSYDHRAINGADAAKFLAKITQYIKNPQKMMM